MPQPDESAKIVLISGINGYIASHIALQLLQQGHKVRGTSRSASAEDHLLRGAFKGYESQYEHYIVPDMTVSGAFDKAVKGVYAIIHTASPIDFSLKTLDDFFGPAVGGNLSILNSAKNHAGSQLKSFVLTSSIAAVVDKWRQAPDHVYTEEDWNTSGEAVAREEFSVAVAYGASKSLAEQALWKWSAENHPTFACSAINPAVVTGPPVSWPATPDKLNITLQPVWNLFAGSKTLPPQIGGAGYIDVRDTARMHIWAALNPSKSNNQRYLLAAGKAPPQAIADILRTHYPERDVLEGEPGKGYTPDYRFVKGEATYSSQKALDAMGIKRFIGFEQSVLDTVTAMERQWPGVAQNFKAKN
jgi:nucleoside-diphosphate-sugar epimerase